MSRRVRIGVVADTHVGEHLAVLPPEIPEILAGVDLILHAGDLADRVVLEELGRVAPVVAVRGNHDEEGGIDELPRDVTVRVGQARIAASGRAMKAPAAWLPPLASAPAGRSRPRRQRRSSPARMRDRAAPSGWGCLPANRRPRRSACPCRSLPTLGRRYSRRADLSDPESCPDPVMICRHDVGVILSAAKDLAVSRSHIGCVADCATAGSFAALRTTAESVQRPERLDQRVGFLVADKVAGLKVKEPFNQPYGMREVHVEIPATKTLLFIGQTMPAP